jgi:4-amino-4-deoxy-L-arabinose transferase-like glycosyltransferase
VDGTQNNSIFSQTFTYNGTARLERGNVYAGAGHPAAFLVRLSEQNASPTHKAKPSWHRLLNGPFGRDDGWLLPAAMIAAAYVLLARRRAGRRDPFLAAAVLWGIWLLVLAIFFSAGGYPNSYYVAVLVPAIGALCGAGASLAARALDGLKVRAALAATVLCSAAYGAYLLRGGTGVPAWLIPVAAIVAAGGAGALIAARQAGALRSPASRVLLTLACMLPLPVVASALMVVRGLGPFAAPYEPASATVSRADERQSRIRSAEAIEQLTARYGTAIPLAADSSILAAPFILATGEEVIPIGGYQGGAPAPSLGELRRRIAGGEVRAFIVPKVSSDPRIVWIATHCKPVERENGHAATPTELYEC